LKSWRRHEDRIKTAAGVFRNQAGTLAALIASFATPGPVSSESYSPKRDAMGLFDCCEVPQRRHERARARTRDCFAQFAAWKRPVVGIDAVVHYENPKDLDYVIGSLDSG
jgi:hypothetical protein